MIQDLPRSVRERLVSASQRRKEDPNLLLGRFAAERLLYRLSRSRHRESFILKGAMLFFTWSGYPHRPTRDLDLLGFGSLSVAQLNEVFTEVCRTPVEDDGLRFPPETIRVEAIRAQDEYGGLRVRLVAMLGRSRIPLQVDVGVGDAVVPPPEEIMYPTLLEFPPPRIRAYRREAVIAEKLEAMVTLGLANSRMKDFFDLWTMARECRVDGGNLVAAVAATFARRKTRIPEMEPEAFGDGFANAPLKLSQWDGFLGRTGLRPRGVALPTVVETIRGFLSPPLEAVRDEKPFEMTWPPGGPWQPERERQKG